MPGDAVFQRISVGLIYGSILDLGLEGLHIRVIDLVYAIVLKRIVSEAWRGCCQSYKGTENPCW